MAEPRLHTGGCHCGAVRYEVTIDATVGNACNCSMCGRAGTLPSFVPDAQFKLLSGEDQLTDYQFNKCHIHHLFCKVCGIKSFAWGLGKDGAKTRAINIRCLDDFDLEGVTVNQVDGKKF